MSHSDGCKPKISGGHAALLVDRSTASIGCHCTLEKWGWFSSSLVVEFSFQTCPVSMHGHCASLRYISSLNYTFVYAKVPGCAKWQVTRCNLVISQAFLSLKMCGYIGQILNVFGDPMSFRLAPAVGQQLTFTIKQIFGQTFTLVTLAPPSCWYLWLWVKYFHSWWMDFCEICCRLSCSLPDDL